MEIVLLRGYESDRGNLNKDMDQILDEGGVPLRLFLSYLHVQVVR